MTVDRYESPKKEHAFIGMWHIVAMEMWDASYFNMEVQAFIEIEPDETGHFQFGLVSGFLDGYVEHDEPGGDRFAFTWEGSDEMDPVSGSGWLRLEHPDEAVGVINLHLGDHSKLNARRAG